MEEVIIAIQERLSAEVEALKYIDMDWNQLQQERPPVQWPCALIDFDRIDFATVKDGVQRAEAEVVITVANLRIVNSSAKAPNRLRAYDTLRLMAAIHQAIDGFDGDGRFRPLRRTALRKVYGDKQAEIYTLTYRTVFTDESTAKP